MKSPLRTLLFSLSAASFSVASLCAAPSFAAPTDKDKPALKIDSDAMDTDYLGEKFSSAEKKLRKAIALCASGCSNKVRAQLHRDLGIVLVAGLKRVDEGKAEFKEAVAAEPDVKMDPAFSSPEAEKAFREATGKTMAVDLTHDPVTEQKPKTPVPVFVEIPPGLNVSSVELFYRAVGGNAFRSTRMHKVSSGYGATIPCGALPKRGTLSYYIIASGAQGNVVGAFSSEGSPQRVRVHDALQGEHPHFPNADPPSECDDDEMSRGDAPEDEGGEEAAVGPACDTNADCDGSACVSGHCAVSGDDGKVRKNWVSLSIEEDLSLVPATTNVCTKSAQNTGQYACIRSNDHVYQGTPTKNKDDSISSGLAPSTMRILVGFDRLLTKNITAGARLGFAFGGGPQGLGTRPFLPFHGEVRGAYWFGSRPFAPNNKLRPFVYLAAGMAQVDSNFTVHIVEDPNSTAVEPASQNVTTWRKSGQAFGALGGGAMYALMARGGIVLDIKVMQLFPTSGTVIAPSLGYAYAF